MKISISVPKPCHENWNAMTPAADPTTGIAGRHCDSCQHTVMDLTRVSDAQLIDLFRKDAMPKCARFSQGQLDRVIALEADRSPRLLPVAAVGLAMAFAAPDAEAQNCTPRLGKMAISRPVQVDEPRIVGEMVATPEDSTDRIIEKVQMGNVSIPIDPVIKGDIDVRFVPPAQVDTSVMDSAVGIQTGQMIVRGGRAEVNYYIDGVKGPGPLIKEQLEALPIITGGIPGTFGDVGVPSAAEPMKVTGRVLDENSEPVPFVSVRVGMEAGVVSDADGRFVLSLSDSLYDAGMPLRIHSIGYASTEVPLGGGHAVPVVPQVPMYVEGKYALTGRVLLDGKPVFGCVVQVVGTDEIITVDDRGFFGFNLTGDASEWTVKAISPDGHLLGSTVVQASALPCCVPVALEVNEEPAIVRPTTIDLGDIVLEPRGEIMMGMWIETTPAKQSLARRAGAPFRWVGRQVSRPFR